MALPSSGTINLEQIRLALGGDRNLGYYRGRQYWRGATPVTISQNPRMSEFYGLGNVAPLNRDMYAIWISTINGGASGSIDIRWWPRDNNIGVHAVSNVNLNSWSGSGAYEPDLYTGFNYGYRVNSGGGLLGFDLLDADPAAVLIRYTIDAGASINLTSTVTANPR